MVEATSRYGPAKPDPSGRPKMGPGRADLMGRTPATFELAEELWSEQGVVRKLDA